MLGEVVLSEHISVIVRLSTIFAGSIVGAVFGNQLYFVWVKFLIWQGEHNGKLGKELESYLEQEGGTIKDMPVTQFLKS